jgi:hypothetical protein
MNQLRKSVGLFAKRVKGAAHLFYHIGIIALSAGIVLSLPYSARLIAQFLLTSWSFIADEKLFLASLEIVLAVLLVLLFNYLGRSWTDKKFARMARRAGLLHYFPARGTLARRRIRLFKEKVGFSRDLLGIFSTGFQTLVEPDGDLHGVIRVCREAKIMLLNPYGEGVTVRAKGILDPEITPERYREQIRQTIHFLKDLKEAQKSIRLKLYRDAPFLKLSVLGETLWLRHYHPSLDIAHMPEYVFAHNQNTGSLFNPLYQYCLLRWDDPSIPEYDLETDELIYRDDSGNVAKREPFEPTPSSTIFSLTP